MAKVDYYKVLGVSVTATDDEIKAAFRTKAKCCHPDTHPDNPVSTALFQALTEAYETLSDPARRALYDAPAVPDVVIKTKKHTYTATALHAEGELATIYRATDEKGTAVLLKISRAASVNDLLEREAAALTAIGTAALRMPSIAPFLPELLEAAAVEAVIGGTKERRRVNVFAWMEGFLSLESARAVMPAGLAGEHAGWIGNRLLSLLAFLGEHGCVHGAVTPDHVLIHPVTHAILLVDWCYSVQQPNRLTAISAKSRAWYPPEVLEKRPASSATDLYMAAECLFYVAGGRFVPSPRAADHPLGILRPNGEPVLMPYEMRRFLDACVLRNPARRPTMDYDLYTGWRFMLKQAFGEPKYVPLVL